jgi:hypothetical protein
MNHIVFVAEGVDFQGLQEGGLSDSGVWKLWNAENVMLGHSGGR